VDLQAAREPRRGRLDRLGRVGEHAPPAERVDDQRGCEIAAVEDGVFFAGDSAGHCLPTTAEGIRTALYFGLACGRELRLALAGRQTRGQALQRYASFCDEHRWAFSWLLGVQRVVGRLNPYPALTSALALMDHQRFVDWSFRHYLEIAPPEFVGA